MTEPGDITSQQIFHQRLALTLESLADINRRSPGFEVMQVLEAQLQFMHECVAEGGSPRRADQDRITLGTLAVKNLEDSDPELASELSRLDYAFRHWEDLPEST